MTEKDHGKLPEKGELREKPQEPEAEKESSHRGEFSAAKSSAASILFAAATAAALYGLTFASRPSSGAGWPEWTWLCFTSLIAFLIMRTGRVSRWRAVFFAAMALGFMARFKAAAVGLTGSAFAAGTVQEVPYCHIALASSILNTVYNQYLALKSGAWAEWGPLSLGFLWLAFTLALGQAWCSWVCWFGGIDDGCSRLLGRFRLKKLLLPPGLRDMPAGILLFFAAVSMMSLKPEFCLWACPLKLTTGFLDPIDAVAKVQFAVFASLAVLTLFLGPIVLGKRVFCGLVCPFGAWQAFFGRLNPFRVTVEEEACTKCRACAPACPTFSIEHPQAAFPEILPYCNRCGECVDACPTRAISYTILDRVARGRVRGKDSGCSPFAELWEVRSLFVLCGLVLGGSIGGLFVPEALKAAFAMLPHG